MIHATTQVVSPLLRAIGRDADVVRAQLHRAVAGESRAVHRIRVASRRLRAALPIAADISREDARDVERELRRITRAFGDLREADVVLESLDAVSARTPRAAAAIARVQAVCTAERDTRRRAVRSKIKRREVAHVLTNARDVAHRLTRASGARASAVLAAAVGRRARQMSAALDEAGTTYGVESLHRLRLCAKKLRYTLEVSRGLFGAAGLRALRDLKRLQKQLGQIHDGQAVQRYIRIAAAEPGMTRDLVAQLTEMDRDLDTSCRRLHARIVARRSRLDDTLDGIRQSVAAYVSPRRVGRMARMPVVRPRRRKAAGE